MAAWAAMNRLPASSAAFFARGQADLFDNILDSAFHCPVAQASGLALTHALDC
jgi:hypothetical protein